jgi:uncharacterized phage protein (TIGR02220 family)
MSKPDIWMPLFIGDYLASTSRLTCEQHGAYLLLIMDYWKNGPPPNDDAILAQICRMAPDAWSNASSIIKGFFIIDDGHLTHNRIDEELEAAKAKKHAAREKAAEAARARWEGHIPKDASSNATSNQQAMLGSCPSPSPLPLPSLQSKPLSASADIAPPLETKPVLLGNGMAKHLDASIEILGFLNERANRRYKPLAANLTLIASRLKEGATIPDCKAVIIRKCKEWGGTDMDQYLRPATLFNKEKFAQYSGEVAK